MYITVAAEANKIDSALAERFRERPNEYTPTAHDMPDMPSGNVNFAGPISEQTKFMIFYHVT